MIKANKQILSTIQFDCGDNDLNEFLLKDSFKNLENSLSKIIIYIIFIKKLNIPSTEEEIKALKRAKKTFEQIEFKR